jgi:hypothetical protein
MAIAASRVFEGAEPLAAVAENNCVHAELDALLAAVHAFKTFAIAFSREVGAVPVAGNDAPGALPVAMFTRFAAVAAASVMPPLFVAVAPICAPAARNGAIDHAAATVVASFTTTFAPVFNAEQCPNTAVITAALFDVPPALGDPPRATRYNTELLKGQGALLAIVMAPVESVVTGKFRRDVGADPLPVVPAA